MSCLQNTVNSNLVFSRNDKANLKGNCHAKCFSWFSYIWVVLDVITSYSKSYNLNCSFLEDMAHRSCTVQIHPVLRVWLADIHCGSLAGLLSGSAGDTVRSSPAVLFVLSGDCCGRENDSCPTSLGRKL